MLEQTVDIERIEQIINLFGNFDENVKRIENKCNVSITSHGNRLKVRGEPEAVMRAVKTVEALLVMINKGEQITEQSIDYVAALAEDGEAERITAVTDAGCICITARGKPVKPKTIGQRQYVEAIGKNTVTIGVGPAGTGKTYLAVACAVNAFRAKEVNRIVLTRPAVEAGEKLGFLPGDLQQKVDPYLRPLYDALFEMLGAEAFARHQERGVIEVAPLAYMRGRTLDDSFIILDEAQNTSREQMKMFLTRLGFNSKMIVNGDSSQIDLPDGKKSGLLEVARILKGIDGIGIIRLDERDVVRHKLVQDIIKAYEKADSNNARKQN